MIFTSIVHCTMVHLPDFDSGSGWPISGAKNICIITLKVQKIIHKNLLDSGSVSGDGWCFPCPLDAKHKIIRQRLK